MTDRDLLWTRWEDVDRLLTETLDLPAAARESYLLQAAANDAPLQALVLRLLHRLSPNSRA